MKESHVLDVLASVGTLTICNLVWQFVIFYVILSCPWIICYCLWQFNALQYRRMDFDEFCTATLSIYQLEARDRWEQHARFAYELFEKEGNRAIVIEELASVCVCYKSLWFESFLIASIVLHYRKWNFWLSMPNGIWWNIEEETINRLEDNFEKGIEYVNTIAGTRSRPICPSSCCSSRLGQAHRWKAELLRFCKVVTRGISPDSCKSSMTVSMGNSGKDVVVPVPFRFDPMFKTRTRRVCYGTFWISPDFNC